MPHPPIFHRTELLLGTATLDRLAQTRVILFGVGGVGSWTAEALVRSGVGHLTLVDSDLVCVTNANRQLMATVGNVGRVKVLELADRLRSIWPRVDVEPIQAIYNAESRDRFDLGSYDYVVDAIDSLSNKMGLIGHALASPTTLFSAMGASAKLDPSQIRVGPFWSVERCRLAKVLRKRLRRHQVSGEFLCVYSPEPARAAAPDLEACGTERCFCPRRPAPESALPEAHEWCSNKARINGSVVHMTATFGFMLAGLVVQDVARLVDAARAPDDPQEGGTSAARSG